MNRRGFLGLLGKATAAAVVAPKVLAAPQTLAPPTPAEVVIEDMLDAAVSGLTYHTGSPSNAQAGDAYFNQDDGYMYSFDGWQWVKMGGVA